MILSENQVKFTCAKYIDMKVRYTITMTLAKALSLRLAELMKKDQWTGYALSNATGVSEATISDIKNQRNVGVNVRIIFELCQGLGIDLATFFDSPLFRGDNIMD